MGLSGKGSIYKSTTWMGVPCFKCPLDMWIYQEILLEIKPDLIVETGTYMGGSALYLAQICDILQNGKVITIDIDKRERRDHPRVEYITGSSIDPSLVEAIFVNNSTAKKVLVILDSDHSEQHVIKELELFSKYVSVGSYMIVEDSNLNGHPTYSSHGPGPWEAVQQFIKKYKNFEVDKNRERFLMTFNPNGYLKKIN